MGARRCVQDFGISILRIMNTLIIISGRRQHLGLGLVKLYPAYGYPGHMRRLVT